MLREVEGFLKGGDNQDLETHMSRALTDDLLSSDPESVERLLDGNFILGQALLLAALTKRGLVGKALSSTNPSEWTPGYTTTLGQYGDWEASLAVQDPDRFNGLLPVHLSRRRSTDEKVVTDIVGIRFEPLNSLGQVISDRVAYTRFNPFVLIPYPKEDTITVKEGRIRNGIEGGPDRLARVVEDLQTGLKTTAEIWFSPEKFPRIKQEVVLPSDLSNDGLNVSRSFQLEASPCEVTASLALQETRRDSGTGRQVIINLLRGFKLEEDLLKLNYAHGNIIGKPVNSREGVLFTGKDENRLLLNNQIVPQSSFPFKDIVVRILNGEPAVPGMETVFAE